MRLLQSLGRKLNVRKMDDWYRVTDNDLRAEGGAVLLESYGSLVSILETLYPNHPWDFKGAGATQVLQQQVRNTYMREIAHSNLNHSRSRYKNH